MGKSVTEWDGTIVRTWLDRRIVAARADQVAAERSGWEKRDDCDMAAAEEMVCTLLKAGQAANAQAAFTAELKALLDRDEYVWRGVYDDRRFDRHVRTVIRKVLKMTKANEGFGTITHYR